MSGANFAPIGLVAIHQHGLDKPFHTGMLAVLHMHVCNCVYPHGIPSHEGGGKNGRAANPFARYGIKANRLGCPAGDAAANAEGQRELMIKIRPTFHPTLPAQPHVNVMCTTWICGRVEKFPQLPSPPNRHRPSHGRLSPHRRRRQRL